MNHLDEGTIVAIRDGMLLSAEARLHMGECPTCQGALESTRTRSRAISAALATLDRPIDTEVPKAKVRARLDAASAGERPHARPLRHLGRAAAVLLLTAGAVYALPGSPLRDWISSRSKPQPNTAGEQVTTPQEATPSAGIEVAVLDGRIRVTLTAVSPGAEVEVAWIEDATARISAAPGSSYSFAEGHAEATVAAGPVRIEVPRAASVISIEVNGRMVLERSEAGLELSGSVLEQTADRIVFSIPEL